MITFVVPGIARPQGSTRSFVNPKTRKVVTVGDNRKTGPWRTEVAWAARQAGCQVLEGSVAVDITVYLPRPRGHFGRRGNLLSSAPAYPTTKPDGDKLLRAIFDALTGVAYRDDAQVVEMTIRKWYCGEGQAPEARVSVGPLAGAVAAEVLESYPLER